MSNKRGKRGSSKNKFTVQLKVRNEEQLQRTLDLRGIHGDKPHINDIIEKIVGRLDDEERQKMLAMARNWRGGKSWSRGMLYECMGEDYPGYEDEDVSYDPYEEIFDGLGCKCSRKLKELNKKLFKRMNKGERKGSKKKYKNHGSEDDDFWDNRKTMFTQGEWSDDLDNEDNYEDQYKCIKFYSDIENEMSVREFYSLKEFNDFCAENNYLINSTDYNNLVNWSVVHCCLDPISLEYGENEIITDNSYGALFWSVSDDITKEEQNSINSTSEARTFTD